MNKQQEKTIEGFIELKKFNQKSILEGFKVTVDEYSTLLHYYNIQDKLDKLINLEAGWNYEN
ncbi:hypothetical protein [Limosilactobacillus reuteri]|uniref:hypothetical protein n=1 Tax=Limosilactobacillus reuteri TaxID=1598 RepID=UPI001C11BAB9|nr:hypothetical protein [Limosilactobacillus reuteri]MBU5283017.1 hypothetical protein [Limosilactobacillus reuteri]